MNPIESIRYLESEAAAQSIAANPYWPKWHSPWWHMVLLNEMGFADQIPKSAVKHLVAGLQRAYPRDGKFGDTTPCPCEIGNITQVLAAAGVGVDHEFPWVRGWLMSQQMPDGGLSCDEDAYKAEPQASSIVGTIAPLEAILLCTKRPFTAEEERFLDRGAQCLMERKLMLGCSAPHNREEKADESDWLKPCFPRFYFYDVLRGLSFILRWAELRQKVVPADAIDTVLQLLRKKFPDGQVRIERHCYEGVGSRIQAASGEWERSKTASRFSLLDSVSEIGEVSPYLTEEWRQAKNRFELLKKQGMIG